MRLNGSKNSTIGGAGDVEAVTVEAAECGREERMFCDEGFVDTIDVEVGFADFSLGIDAAGKADGEDGDEA